MTDKTDKGQENGSCNRSACQKPGAIWYNHGSHAWYCEGCRRDIEWDSFNKRDWAQNWFPKKGHPMFETRAMIDARQNVTPGPAFSMPRAEELSRETGHPLDWCIRVLEAQAEGKSYMEAAREVGKRDPELKVLEVARTMNAIWAKDRELSERDAEKDGKLWAIAGALASNRAAFLIVNGRGGATLSAMANAELPECYGIVETVTIGSKKDAAKAALDLARADEYSIRFL